MSRLRRRLRSLVPAVLLVASIAGRASADAMPSPSYSVTDVRTVGSNQAETANLFGQDFLRIDASGTITDDGSGPLRPIPGRCRRG